MALRVALALLQSAVLAAIAYNLVIAVWGLPHPPSVPAGRRAVRFRVVVPAHDEAQVIGSLLSDLERQHYPRDRVTVVVIADHCSDATAEIASTAAVVVQRDEGEGGKGRALAWYLERHPLAKDECLFVLDADNRAGSDLLSRVADHIEAGAEVVQCFLDVSNPDASPVTVASALTYWAGNRMVQLPRGRLGWYPDLGGTGMAFTARALSASGGFGASLVEDRQLLTRLVLAGVPVAWAHDVHVFDEKPVGLRVSYGQRRRWHTGKQLVVRDVARDLLVSAFRNRSLATLDVLIRLVQPSRTLVTLGSVVVAAIAAVLAPTSAWTRIWAVAAAVQVTAPLAFLARERVPGRYLLRYPLVSIIGVLAIAVRIPARFRREWYHTPHRGSPPPRD